MNDNLPTIGHNRPPADGNMLADQQLEATAQLLLLEAEALANVVDRWRAEVGSIEDDQRAAECSDLLDKLNAAKKTATVAHETEKRPYLTICHAIDDKYRPIRSLLDAATKPVQSMLGNWIGRLRIRKAEEAAAAQREAERLAAAAEAAKAKANTIIGSLAAQVAANRAEAAAQLAAKTASAKAQAKGTLGGRAKTLRTTWFATVTAYPLACRYYANHPEVIAVLEKLASAEARGGARVIPGFKIDEKEVVA